MYVTRLVIQDANSTFEKQHLLMSVTQSEGTSVYCLTYNSRGEKQHMHARSSCDLELSLASYFINNYTAKIYEIQHY